MLENTFLTVELDATLGICLNKWTEGDKHALGKIHLLLFG